MMELDFSKLTAYQRYKLSASLIVPRPFALVTTIGTTGVVNAAAFGARGVLVLSFWEPDYSDFAMTPTGGSALDSTKPR